MTTAAGTPRRNGNPHPEPPYKGLEPYTSEDEGRFFGRNDERDILVANLRASRLTLVYGDSGVGKSSLLQAGVMPELERQADAQREEPDRPGFEGVHFATWTGHPARDLGAAVEDALTKRGIRPELPGPGEGSLHSLLTHWGNEVGVLLLVLDQFEEYFLYHPRDDAADGFAEQFSHVVNDLNCPVHILVSMREDALAKLDLFEDRIPRLFSNYLRVEHLSRDEGRTAIVGPLEDGTITPGEGLVDAVLDQVPAGLPLVGDAGVGSVTSDPPKGIEASYLQLVMLRLWREEMDSGSEELRLETLKRLGGAEGIIRGHLDEALAGFTEGERDVADQMFRHLVTPSGSKIAHTPEDLASYVQRRPDQVEPLLRRLAGDARILRTLTAPGRPHEVRYEIYHDKLAAAVLAWRADRRLRAAEARAPRQRIMRRAGWFVAGVAVLTLIPTVIALATTETGSRVAHWFAVIVPSATLVVTAIFAAWLHFHVRRP